MEQNVSPGSSVMRVLGLDSFQRIPCASRMLRRNVTTPVFAISRSSLKVILPRMGLVTQLGSSTDAIFPLIEIFLTLGKGLGVRVGGGGNVAVFVGISVGVFVEVLVGLDVTVFVAGSVCVGSGINVNVSRRDGAETVAVLKDTGIVGTGKVGFGVA